MTHWRCRLSFICVLNILVSYWASSVSAYSQGAGAQACSSLTPWHSANQPQTIPVPYVITVSKTSYRPLEQVVVTIQACKGYSFKGFLIQPRLAQFSTQDVKIGVFGMYNNAPYQYTCPDSRNGIRGQALTHTSSEEKTKIRVVWQAPRVPQGHVVFRQCNGLATQEVQNSPSPKDEVGHHRRKPRFCVHSISTKWKIEWTQNPWLAMMVGRRATILQEYTTFWVAVNSPIVYDAYSSVRLAQSQVLSLTNNISPVCNEPVQPPSPPPRTSTPQPTTQRPTTTTPKPTTPKPTTTTTKPTTTTPKPTTTTPKPTTTTPKPTTTTPKPTTTTPKPTTTTPKPTTTTPKPTTTTPKPTTTTPQPTTSQSTMKPFTPPQGTYLPPDPDCNKTKGCFHDCRRGVCSFIISWRDREGYLDMEINAHIPLGGDRWVAVGFSYDDKMGSDSVTECMSVGGRISAFQSYNSDTHSNSRLRDPKLGLSQEYGSFVDGIFTCGFTREKLVPTESRLFNLNKPWHILFAHGTAIEGLKLPHMYDPAPPTSENIINFQAYLVNMPTTTTSSTSTTSSTTTTTVAPTTTTTTTHRPTTTTSKVTQRPTTPWQPPTTLRPFTTKAPSTTIRTTTIHDHDKHTHSHNETLQADFGCGKTKGCFAKCSGGQCDFIITWNDTGEHVQFEMRKKFSTMDPNDHWIAVGFSEDKRMGDDSVTECIRQEGFILVHQSFNDVTKSNTRLKQSGLGLSDVSGSYIDGVMICQFSRKKQLPDEKQIFDLNNDYYMFFAYGEASEGVKRRHSVRDLPIVSSKPVDLQKHSNIQGKAVYFLVKVHGCLMVIAWICLASIGIIAVRYYKTVWLEETCLRERIWYQSHKFCMITLFLCVMVGIILIFVEIQGYSQIDGKTFHQAHPVMGLLVTLFTIANPIIAILRPLPGTIKRKIFNWIHWAVGTGAHFLAIVTLFAGVELAKARAPFYISYILIAYVCYLLIVFFILEVHSFISKRAEHKRDQTYIYEMHRKPHYSSVNHSLDIEPPYSKVKKAIFGSHILITVTVTIIICILLFIS